MANSNAETLIERLISAEVRQMRPYHVPDHDGLLKLDAMENPHQWPASLREQWLQQLRDAAINRYPDAGAGALKAQLRRVFDLSQEQGVLLGNGSDEIIQLLAMAVRGSGRGVLAPEPGFVMYKMIASWLGMPYSGVPLDANFDLDLDAMLTAIERDQPALIFLALPNNPTGNVFAAERVQAVVEAADGLVILDEAYTAFTDSDHLDWARRFDNVLVMRTLSKIGLAGLRLGVLMGSAEWIAELEKLRMPYNVNVLTQTSALFALQHYDMLLEQCADIRARRAELIEQLQQLPLRVWPSEANFVLARCEQNAAPDVATAMRERGVLIKCLHGAHPALDNTLRFTVGTSAENAQCLAALREALAAV